MRIALLTASLAAGRNGIGDYTRLLAEALGERGCATLQLALAGPEAVERAGVRQWPAAADWEVRLTGARAALRDFAPDVAALQYAPHAWHPRGLPRRRARDLAGLLAPYRGLVVFHELWECPVPPCDWRGRLVRPLQRPISLALARRVAAAAPGGSGCEGRADGSGNGGGRVATTNVAYRDLLARGGLDAAVLPLFGNVPPVPCERLQVRAGLIGAVDPAADRDAALLCGLFGSLHRGIEYDAVWRRLGALGRQRGVRVCVVFLGGSDLTPERLASWQAQAPELRFRAFGRLPDAELSPFLAALDVGLTPYQTLLLGKSGSAAALFEHGTPVVSLRGGAPPEAAGLPPRFQRLFLGGLGRLEAALAAGSLPRGEPGSLVGAVADGYLALLGAE